MNNMNNEKTMFSVEDDGSGLAIKAQGKPTAVVMITAIGLFEYFGENKFKFSMEDFIHVLKKACEDSELLELMFQAVSLYADNNDDGLKAFAMLMAVANAEESMLCGKMN